MGECEGSDEDFAMPICILLAVCNGEVRPDETYKEHNEVALSPNLLSAT
jgi:hypothetical protein